MKYRDIGKNVELVETDCYKPELVLASENIVKETLAIRDTYEYVLINDDTVEYYTIVDKNGMNSLAFNATKMFLGTLAGTLASHHAGGRTREKLVFVKLKNDKRILMIVGEGYMHLIRCKNKRHKDDMDEDDIQWVKYALDKNDIELI